MTALLKGIGIRYFLEFRRSVVDLGYLVFSLENLQTRKKLVGSHDQPLNFLNFDKPSNIKSTIHLVHRTYKS